MSDAKKNSPQQPTSETRQTASKPAAHVLLKVLTWLLGLAAAGTFAVLMLVAMALATAYPNLPDISGLT
ncbi:hypothetical protein, partial [Escherichia coli]